FAPRRHLPRGAAVERASVGDGRRRRRLDDEARVETARRVVVAGDDQVAHAGGRRGHPPHPLSGQRAVRTSQRHPDHRRDAGLHRPLTRFATPRDPSPAHGSAPVDDEKVAPFGRWTVAHRVPYRHGGAPSESTTTRRWPWAHWKTR